jgi:hypothetical protein
MAKAKEQQANQSPIDIHEVATRLFVQHWKPRGNLADWLVAVECYRGANELARVSEAIAGGYSPDDVIADRQLQAEEILT